MSLRLSAAVAVALAGVAVGPAASQAAPRTINACMITTNAKCPGIKLQGQNLAGATMTRANLRNADLRGANLSRGNFRKANLSGANLAGANLRGADFTGANLSFAQLQGTSAAPSSAPRTGQSSNSSGCSSNTVNAGAQFVGANLTGVNMAGANYSYGNFSQASMAGVDAQGTNFSCAILQYARLASLPKVQATNANGICYVPLYTNVQGANFQGANLAVLTGMGWSYTEPPSFSPACSKSGGSYTAAATYNTDWSTANISYANLQNANFTYALLPTAGSSALWQDATWNATVCPNGKAITGSPCPASP